MKDPSTGFNTILDRLFDDETVSIPLVYNLSDLMPEELAAFRQRWPEQSAERRRELARHMADISEVNFEVDFALVLEGLLQDPDPDVRQAALDGLWDSDNLSLVPQILTMVRDDPDGAVRTLAASTLGHYVLMDQWGQLPTSISGQIVAALLAELDRGETAMPLRRAILETISSAPHPRVPGLIEDAYSSGNFEMQLSAVFAMGGSADGRWLPIVLDAMGDHDVEMRLEAARAAGNIGRSDAISNLADLTLDDDLGVRLAAIHALGQIGSDEAAEILQDLAEDPDAEEVYDAVEEALEEINWLGSQMDLSLLDLDVDENQPS